MGEGILDSVVLLTVLPLKNVVVLIFLPDAKTNHSVVVLFARSTNRITHKGTFTKLVQYTKNKFHPFVQRHSALVVSDASRTDTLSIKTSSVKVALSHLNTTRFDPDGCASRSLLRR